MHCTYGVFLCITVKKLWVEHCLLLCIFIYLTPFKIKIFGEMSNCKNESGKGEKARQAS